MKKQMLMLAVCLATAMSFAATYYVSPSGDDNNAGTSDAPVATISKGISKATAAGDIVSIADGDYEIGTRITVSQAITIQGNVADCSKVVVNCKKTVHALYCDSVNGWVVSGITFTNGSSVVYATKAVTVSHCAFRDASVNQSGSALYFQTGAATDDGEKLIEDCVFENQKCDGSGSKGPVFIYGGSNATYPITLRRCVFQNCYAGNNGGAIGQTNNGGVTLTAENCEFSGCQGVAGGAVFLQTNSGKTATFRNCLFAGNTSRSGSNDGGSAVYTKSAAVYENCTFADNVCSGNSGTYCAAVRNNGGATTLTNCVFWNNTRKDGGEISVYSTSYSATYSAAPTAAALTGETNVTLDASPFAAPGVYTLAPTVGVEANPCIDGGTTLSWMTADAKDLAGAARVFNSVPDIGAYEYGAAISNSGFLMYIDAQ